MFDVAVNSFTSVRLSYAEADRLNAIIPTKRKLFFDKENIFFILFKPLLDPLAAPSSENLRSLLLGTTYMRLGRCGEFFIFIYSSLSPLWAVSCEP